MAGRGDSVLEQPVVQAAAKKHQRTPAQVVLRWGVQRGTAVIPKTSNPKRLAENLALFDFELSADEMAAISGLDQNRRFNDPGVFCEAAFHTFFPIYE
jgi:D-xylose reductase